MDVGYFNAVGFLANMKLATLVGWVASGAMIFGGVIPFLLQYLEIKRSGNVEGFSIFVCLTLLIANSLRIMFWFGKHYELPLVAQSIVMIATMFVLINLCTYMKNRHELIPGQEHTFFDFDRHYFWRWTDFSSYIQFYLMFNFAVGIVTYLLINNVYYIELIGFLSLFTEAMLGAPQFYRNLLKKSTLGMSVKMVITWTCGDIFKTCYFIVKQQPIQFAICGLLQVSLDVAILTQVFYYEASHSLNMTKSAIR